MNSMKMIIMMLVGYTNKVDVVNNDDGSLLKLLIFIFQ